MVPEHDTSSVQNKHICYRLLHLSLARATLEGMWNKAEEYLRSKVDEVAAGNPKNKMVTSRSVSTSR